MDTLENRLQKRIHVSLYALLFLTVLLGISVLLEGCSDKCEITNSYVYYEPVYTDVEELRAAIALEAPQEIKNVGKIYYQDGFMYVNEPGEGIHIIDNHDPAHPAPRHFLKIPGNFDLAIKDHTLYADSFVDLVAFDITDIATVHEVKRLEGVFKNYNVMGYTADVNCCVITSWAEQKTVQVTQSDCSYIAQPWGGMYYAQGIAIPLDMNATFSSKTAIAPGTGSESGVGGSLARFTLSKDHLYMLDGGDLQTVDVTEQANPVVGNRSYVAWDIETIFPHNNNLFIGSSSGMHILDITIAEAPTAVSTYAHLRSCDPVVVDDNYAYVTLRSGTTCNGFTNQLEVIDIADLTSPKLLQTYPMTNPHGLGIDKNTLFICDGDAGLKAYDASDINAIASNMLAHYENINAMDVIPNNDVLIMIGNDGIFQYDYADPADIKLLSQISIHHN
ncbi:MAG TPA: hypothetical protein VK666_25065 [Chryseolinea sp.]|nr:hypothetical protein [Chryseolinea sp.]